MHTCIETTLVMFEFMTDDIGFRSMLFEAIDSGKVPDFSRYLGAPGSSGRNYTALWRVELADQVRAWAKSVGIEIRVNLGRD